MDHKGIRGWKGLEGGKSKGQGRVSGFHCFGRKKIQEFSSPVLEFSRGFQSQFAAEIYKIQDIHH